MQFHSKPSDDAYQRPPAFEGPGESPAVPRDIGGYEARVDGDRVLYRRHGAPLGAPDAFRDVGQRVEVLDWRNEKSTLAALELSAAKWVRFVVIGNAEFKARCARLAAEHGFQITNPELRETIERERARLDAATTADIEPEPAQEPDIAPEVTPGRAPPTGEPPVPREAVDPEIARIAAVCKDADKRGTKVQWTLPVSESWDGDVDRPREFQLRASQRRDSLPGTVTRYARSPTGSHTITGAARDQDGATLEGAVESLNAARERSRVPQR